MAFLAEPNAQDMSRLRGRMEDIGQAVDDKKRTIKLMHAPVFGTVTATAGTSVLLKAGATELSGRTLMTVKNTSRFLVKYGPTSPSEIYQGGFPIDPGETVSIEFDTSTAVSVYARSQGGAATLEIMEA